MGIYGLTTFIRKRLHQEAASSSSTQTETTHHHPTFQSNFDLTAHASTLEKPLVILVDALSVLPRGDTYDDLESCLKATTLPDYFFLHESISRLYKVFRENNIELIFYFDTPTGEHHLKKETLLSRKDQDIGALIDVQDAICGLKRLDTVSDLGAPLWGIQCHYSLRSLGARIVNCIGEADYQLAQDGKHAFAIISEDSDCALMQGTRWIPYSTVKINDDPSPSQHKKKITCSFTSPEALSTWLELPMEFLADFATLVGNDYTKPILRETERGADFVAKVVVASNFSLPRTSSDIDLSGIDSASHHRTPNIELIARALSTEEGRAKFEELLKSPDWAELRDITEFNRRFYTGNVLAMSPELENMYRLAEKMVRIQVFQQAGQPIQGIATEQEIKEIQQYYYGLQILRKIREGTLPPSSFGVWLSGQHLGSIRPEYIDDNDIGGFPSSDQLASKLLAATSLLLGRDDIINGQRVGVSYELQPIKATSEVPQFLPPSIFPQPIPGESVFARACLAAVSDITALNVNKWELLTHALHPFPTLLQNNNPKDTRLVSLPEELSSSLKTAVLICRHLIGASFECGKPIELFYIENIIKSIIILHHQEVELEFISHRRRRTLLKKVKLSKPSLPLISISTYFQVIHSRFIHIMQILGLYQPFFENPLFSCSTFLFHPPLFVYACQRGADFSLDATSPALQELLGEWEVTNFNYTRATLLLSSSMNAIVSVFDPKVFKAPVIEAPLPAPKEVVPPATPTISVTSLSAPQSDLPISTHLEIIAAQIRRQQVAVIQGATGCGKSSRVPQAIYRDCAARQERVKIIITQPRRVAATSLARRVASEMGEPVGQTVGFKVMGNSQSDKSTSITYVTLGWLLAKLTYKPESFLQYTHLILDEIHERGLDADILYVLVKKLLHNPTMYSSAATDGSQPTPTSPKIILMSATCNAEEFAKYFSPNDPPETVVIGKNPFPVEVYYLDQLLNHPCLRDKIPYSKQSLLRMAKQSNKLMLQDSADLYKLLVEVIKVIAQAHRNEEGGNCVLVFLAGIQDIEDAIEELEALMPPEVLPLIQQHVLHSMLEEEDSVAVFSPVPSGITRVVLSTNIAESSITLPGVRYVIDFGTHKEVAYNEQFQCEALMKRLISKSSAQQRRGRAGRLFPGTIFRFYSEEVFEMEMSPFEEPEILRVSLSSAVLRLKSNFRKSPVLSDVEQILSETMVPPEKRSVQLAFDELLRIGALQYTPTAATEALSYKDTAASPLGVFLSTLAVDVKLGRMIAYGFLFRDYLVHTIVMVASLSSPNVFMKPMPLSVASSYRDYNYRISSVIKARINFDCGVHSDCISTLKMFAASLKTKEFMRWCFSHGIHSKRMIALWSRVRELTKAVLNLLPPRSPFIRPIQDLLDLVTSRSTPTYRKSHWIVKSFNTLYESSDDIANLKFILAMSLSHNLLSTLDAKGKGKKAQKTLRLQQHGLNAQFDEKRSTLLAAPCILAHTPETASKLFGELLGSTNFKVSLPAMIQTKTDKKTGVPMTMLALEFQDTDKAMPNGALARVPTAMRTLLSLPKNGDILLDDPTPQRSYFSSTGIPENQEEQALFITSITTKYEALNWRMNASNQVKLSGPTRTVFVDPQLVEGGYSGPLYAIASTLLKVGSILLAENVTILPCSSQSALTSLILLVSSAIELQSPSQLTTMVEIIRGYPAGTTKSTSVVDWVVSLGKSKPFPCAVSSTALPLVIEMAEFIKEFLRSDFFDQAPVVQHRGAPPRSDPSSTKVETLNRLLEQIQNFRDFLSPAKTKELKQNPPPIQPPPSSSSSSSQQSSNGGTGQTSAAPISSSAASNAERDAEIVTNYRGESPHVTQSLLIRCNAETGLIGEKVSSVCMTTFDDLVAYVKHVTSQHGSCPICSKEIVSLVGKLKMKHMKKCFKNLKILRCKACDRNFTERKALIDHFVKKHTALWQEAKKRNSDNPTLPLDVRNQPLIKPREPEPDTWTTTTVPVANEITSFISGGTTPSTIPPPTTTVVPTSAPAKKKEIPRLNSDLDPKTLTLMIHCHYCDFMGTDQAFLNHATKAQHGHCAICREPILSHWSPTEIRKHVQACWRKAKPYHCPYCDRAGLQEAKHLQGHIELHHKDILAAVGGGGANGIEVPDSWEDLAPVPVPKASGKKQTPKKVAALPPRFPAAVPKSTAQASVASSVVKLAPTHPITIPSSSSSGLLPIPPALLPPTPQELEQELIRNIKKALNVADAHPMVDSTATNGGSHSTPSPSPSPSPASSSSSSSSPLPPQQKKQAKKQYKPPKPKGSKAKVGKGGPAPAPGSGPAANPAGRVPSKPKAAGPTPPNKKQLGNGVSGVPPQQSPSAAQ